MKFCLNSIICKFHHSVQHQSDMALFEINSKLNKFNRNRLYICNGNLYICNRSSAHRSEYKNTRKNSRFERMSVFSVQTSVDQHRWYDNACIKLVTLISEQPLMSFTQLIGLCIPVSFTLFITNQIIREKNRRLFYYPLKQMFLL